MFFEVKDRFENIRISKLKLNDIEIETPVFMPVGTQATVKTLSSFDVWDIGYRLILVNSYHLYLQPGEETIKKFNGVKNFMNWKGLLLSDSGGFQVLSLSDIREIKEDGVVFKSFIDGSLHFFSPEFTVKFQETLGVDIMMTLDICPPYGISEEELKKFTHLSIDWAKRGKSVKEEGKGQLFAVIQGGLNLNLRLKALEELEKENFPGYGIGGLSIGEPWSKTKEFLLKFVPQMPQDKPRYFMGLGDPISIMDAVEAGVDMFDCVYPTRIARNRTLLTKYGKLRITKSEYKMDERPIEEDCDCFTCRNFSRAYLHHLFKAKEILAPRLATIHNLRFMYNFMEKLRNSIKNRKYFDFRKEFETDFLTNFKRDE
ncbi:MAG: tRNA guanosine(34) transglycosylase Tgt [Caldisericia bacterium]|jgi:queuine tRNA-ribosyltransferase|nr:tRNA guanosine(34) transglycosylase Tgt [Caldisericia bacterium]